MTALQLVPKAASCFRESQESEEGQVGGTIGLQVSPHRSYAVQFRGKSRKQDRRHGWDLEEELGHRLVPERPNRHSLSPWGSWFAFAVGRTGPCGPDRDDHLGSGGVGLEMEAEIPVGLIPARRYARGAGMETVWRGPSPSDKGGHQQAGIRRWRRAQRSGACFICRAATPAPPSAASRLCTVTLGGALDLAGPNSGRIGDAQHAAAGSCRRSDHG